MLPIFMSRWTNVFCDLDKYILQLGQIHFELQINRFCKYILFLGQIQVIGLFTMGGQEVDQEVVLACVKDIIGEPGSKFQIIIY